MKLSISETRKRLPELARRVRKNASAKVEITVRDEVVAELRPALRFLEEIKPHLTIIEYNAMFGMKPSELFASVAVAAASHTVTRFHSWSSRRF